jgi:uncharacterized protein (DUF58 family)
VTGTGRALLVAVAVMAAAAVWLDYPELFVLAAAGAATMLVAVAWVWRPRSMLTAVRVVTPTEPQAGRRAAVVVTVTNTGRRRGAAVLARDRFGGQPWMFPVPALAVGVSHTVTHQIPTTRRGTVALGPTVVTRQDPLGVFRLVRQIGPPGTVRVYPRWYESRVPGLDRGTENERGSHAAVLARGDISFHSLREYRAGDPRRAIHWRSTARLRVPMVRHEPVPDEPRQLLVLDTAADAYPPEVFEEAVCVAASLVVAIRALGQGLVLCTSGGRERVELPRVNRVPGARGPAFDLLCDVRQRAVGRGLTTVLRETTSAVEGGVLGVVTGELPEVSAAAISHVRSRFQLVYVVQVGAVAPPRLLAGVRRVQVTTAAELAGVGLR